MNLMQRMMSKSLVVAGFVILGFFEVCAEGVIRGIIVDKRTQEPIVSAAVLVENATVGAATDPDGRFLISGIHPGKYTLKISCISYASVIIEGVEVVNNRETELRV